MNKMFQPMELFVGLRYTRARREKHFISFISLASMIGIAIGVLVLITVLSVMNGFEQTMRERIMGMLAHVTVSEHDLSVSDWQNVQQDLLDFPGVKAVSPFIEKPAMLNQGDEARAAVLQGIVPELEQQVSTVFKHVIKGDMQTLQPGSFNVAIGATMAKELKVDVGDALTLVSPSESALETGEMPALQRFTIAAIFRVDMQQFDTTTAYVNLEDAAKTFEMGNDVTGLRMTLSDLYLAPTMAQTILQRMSPSWQDMWANDWTNLNKNQFKAIQAQKSVMFIILMLIIAVAAFNLVSTLVMVVTDKEGDIAILRTLGLSSGRVMKIFMVQGTLIGVFGTLIGVILGVLLANNLDVIVPFLERLFDTHFINADVYFISELESRVNPGDVLVIALSALFMSILATLYPAWRASKVQPAEALRYE
ncbi:lipoprotein-releasing ABC transporter permease subunit [Thiothrix winogradskyi]|uniref:Lipoprotein-releasing ABC transporter permease subunit n=1 Tax=Thiothrix winogradskyi TaxID=96472 RepID=A0ABY3SXE4_9GAMM|nr:lipoprotein-releasing ABC transporter permease subunit [Thiothrix winogradskyi]UJS23549.1 lipoprotein-releasing ABC transporter permease subunit [Thiothrix winogradskyi]